MHEKHAFQMKLVAFMMFIEYLPYILGAVVLGVVGLRKLLRR